MGVGVGCGGWEGMPFKKKKLCVHCIHTGTAQLEALGSGLFSSMKPYPRTHLEMK